MAGAGRVRLCIPVRLSETVGRRGGIGQVLWYIQGRYNANAVTVDGVPANSTAWTGPIAASIFQSIRSDNYNGPTPPTTSNFGTAGWYLDQPSGNLYANAAYLRGELVTGVSGAQRVEINKGVSNKVAVYNSSNTLLASFGGTGTSTDAILRLNPIIAGTTAYGADTVIPNPSGTNYVAASYNGQTTDASLEGVVCGWFTVGSTTVCVGAVGTRNYGSGVVSGFLGYQDSAAYSAAVRGYNNAGGTEVSIADSSGYAINVRSGSIRYGSYTFSAFNGSTTQFLRGDGTFAAPAAAGSNTQVQYNSSGSFAGSANFTFDGSNVTVKGNQKLQQDIPELLYRSSGDVNKWFISANISDSVNGGISIGSGASINTGTTYWNLNSSGNMICGGVYSATVGGTNRDVYVDSTGLIGYVSSTRASKLNIQAITDVSWIHQLSPVTFYYRAKDKDGNLLDEADGPIAYGLIAEDVEGINSDLCYYDEINNNQVLKGINYSKLVIPLLKEVQDLRLKMQTLEARIAALEAK